MLHVYSVQGNMPDVVGNTRWIKHSSFPQWIYTHFFSIVLVTFIKLRSLLKGINILCCACSTVWKPQGVMFFSIQQVLWVECIGCCTLVKALLWGTLKHLRTWLMHILSAKMGLEICSICVTLFRPSFSSFGHLGYSFGQPGSKNKARNFERFFFSPLADWCVFLCLPNCAVLLFTFTLCMALSNQQWKWKLRAQAVLAELEELASWSLREFSFPPAFLHSVALGSALPASSSCFCLLYWWPSEDHKEGQEGPLLPLP